MKRLGILVATLALVAGPATAQQALVGSWQGDKALGDVYIEEDGSGTITFLHDPQLTMAIEVEQDGSTFVISQAEPNRDAFYTGVFDPAIARVLTEQARPMVWEFDLSSDGSALVGTKHTTFVEFTAGPNPRVLSIDNDYSRSAEWHRLTGRVATPEIMPDPATTTLPVRAQLATDTPGAQILYTTNGEPPTRETATVYRTPISVDDTTTIRAIAVRDGWQDSRLAETVYVGNEVQGDGMSIRTPRVMALGGRQEWYHVNNVGYTSMYYTAVVKANTLYEFRIWDSVDGETDYDSEFRIVEIYLDQDKDEKQIFQSPDHNQHEFYTNRAGRIYIEVCNRYYQGFGEMAMRLRGKR